MGSRRNLTCQNFSDSPSHIQFLSVIVSVESFFWQFLGHTNGLYDGQPSRVNATLRRFYITMVPSRMTQLRTARRTVRRTVVLVEYGVVCDEQNLTHTVELCLDAYRDMSEW